MSRNEYEFERADASVIDEWKEKKKNMRQQAAHAEKGLEEHLRESLGEMGNPSRRNIANEIINASKDPTAIDRFKNVHNGGSFNRTLEDQDSEVGANGGVFVQSRDRYRD